MFSFMQDGGPGMMLFAVIIIGILVQTVIKINDLFIKKDIQKSQMERGINSILFWGAICAVLGFYFHYLGLYIAMGAIMEATDISPIIIAQGYQMSLITILSGLIILVISSCIWFFLRFRLRQLQ